MARPRRCGLTSAATRVWLMGIMPPSATPISSRAPSSNKNELAIPDRKEQQEKATEAIINTLLRLPVLSDRKPMPNAATAQVNDNALPRFPTWVLVRFRSGFTNGIRKPSALRSKKTMPKLRLIRVTRIA